LAELLETFGLTLLRFAPSVDKSTFAMPIKRVKQFPPPPRQIIGISLHPDVVAAFKAEAARRNIAVKTLFLEMWDSYTAPKKPK
jgi:hypothetical protein